MLDQLSIAANDKPPRETTIDELNETLERVTMGNPVLRDQALVDRVLDCHAQLDIAESVIASLGTTIENYRRLLQQDPSRYAIGQTDDTPE